MNALDEYLPEGKLLWTAVNAFRKEAGLPAFTKKQFEQLASEEQTAWAYAAFQLDLAKTK